MDAHFDVILFGTGLTESIVAAALSKAGFRIAHIDENAYYGGDEASLSLDELIKWADDRSFSASEEVPSSAYTSSQRSTFTRISRSPTQLPHSRQYSLSLCPAIIPAIGPLVSSLVSSGVARYGGFKLVEQIVIYQSSGKVMRVPGSKEDIFKNKAISLLDKRRLMRFLMFALSDFEGSSELNSQADTPFLQFLQNTFSLNDELAQVVVYSLAFCISSTDATLPALQRVRRYLQSAGRYGSSSFIIGQYGGAGEISQGFCRTSAVYGGVYILGKHVLAINEVGDQLARQEESGLDFAPRYTVTLEDMPDTLSCDLIISRDYFLPHLLPAAISIPPSNSPEYLIARCIAIADQPIPSHQVEASSAIPQSEAPAQLIDNGLVVFPPSSLVDGSPNTSVTVLVTGQSSMSAPSGKLILYFAMPIVDDDGSSPETLLGPYLSATLSLISPPSSDAVEVSPLFTLFYVQHSSTGHTTAPPSNSRAILTPSLSMLLSESLDSATLNAQAVFQKVIGILKSERLNDHTVGEADNVPFWPPLDDVDDDTDSW